MDDDELFSDLLDAAEYGDVQELTYLLRAPNAKRMLNRGLSVSNSFKLLYSRHLSLHASQVMVSVGRHLCMQLGMMRMRQSSCSS